VALLERSWSRFTRSLAGGLDTGRSRESVLARYREPWRHYHTLDHLTACLAWFEQTWRLADHPAEVEAALWFHDAVYDPRRSDNEERSAELADAILREGSAAIDVAARVARLVLATKRVTDPADADETLLTDIDLAILGAAPDRYVEYEHRVRAEYAFVPEDAFWQARSLLLHGLLARRTLYGTRFFFDRLEGPARENMARSLAAHAS